jgi:lipoate---protein ligase
MPERVVTEKVPGGKLLRIKVDYDNVINSVKITGDFFLHPEESITEIENALVGKSIHDDFAAIIRQATDGVEFIGISPEAISDVLKRLFA